MLEIRDWYQLNESSIFVNVQRSAGKPFLAAAVPVPAAVDGTAISFSDSGAPQAPEGQALRWVTTLNYKSDSTFGDEGTGAWGLVADNTHTTLYQTVDGAEYTPSLDADYDGYGAIPAWLTTQPRPSALHNWVDGAWYADPAAVEADQAAKVLAAAQATITTETARATAIIDTIQPAVTGGYADPGDAEVLAAWQQYRYRLSKVAAQAGYPETIDWPVAPDAVPA